MMTRLPPANGCAPAISGCASWRLDDQLRPDRQYSGTQTPMYQKPQPPNCQLKTGMAV